MSCYERVLIQRKLDNSIRDHFNRKEFLDYLANYLRFTNSFNLTTTKLPGLT